MSGEEGERLTVALIGRRSPAMSKMEEIKAKREILRAQTSLLEASLDAAKSALEIAEMNLESSLGDLNVARHHAYNDALIQGGSNLSSSYRYPQGLVDGHRSAIQRRSDMHRKVTGLRQRWRRAFYELRDLDEKIMRLKREEWKNQEEA
jgi:hypothetical protein